MSVSGSLKHTGLSPGMHLGNINLEGWAVAKELLSWSPPGQMMLPSRGPGEVPEGKGVSVILLRLCSK